MPRPERISPPPGTGDESRPVLVVMFCPKCEHQHLDGRWWAHRPHLEHVCRFCGHRWDGKYPSIGVTAARAAQDVLDRMIPDLEAKAEETRGKNA